jgi:hypothetical protein
METFKTKPNVEKMKSTKKDLQKRINKMFDKYGVSQEDRPKLHSMIRGFGMLKLRIKKSAFWNCDCDNCSRDKSKCFKSNKCKGFELLML